MPVWGPDNEFRTKNLEKSQENWDQIERQRCSRGAATGRNKELSDEEKQKGTLSQTLRNPFVS